MGKKTWIIFSLILSIISVIYLLCDYSGILRHFKICNRSMDNYITKYLSLPKADKDRVVVSFYIDDEKQLDNLIPFINSILNQNVRVDDIAMTIQYKNMGKVSEELKKIVTVYGISKDYGDNNKLIPVVLREPDANTKIIIVEPMIYHEYFVSDMVDMSNEEPDKVIYGKNGETRYGVLIKTKFFDNDFSDCPDNIKCCEWIGRCSKRETKEIGNDNIYKL